MKRGGIHALVGLDGAPVTSRDANAMALPYLPAPILAHGIDVSGTGQVSVAESAGRLTILLGILVDPEAWGRTASEKPVDLARAALDRFGDEAPAHLLGEWTLFDWREGAGVTMTGSLTRRDPVLFAHRGNRLAIAPDLASLARLDWVDRDVDPAGLLFALGRDHLRMQRGERTALAGVGSLPAGATLRADATGLRIGRCSLDSVMSPFTGSFDEAVEQAEALMRRIIRARMADGMATACLLSGGLDSSITTWLAAEESRRGAPPVCLTSAVAPGRGVEDERAFAAIVANHLRIPLDHVVPPRERSPYRPGDAALAQATGPIIGPRHYLYEAFGTAADARGARQVIDGCFGERTVTGRVPPPAERLREIARIVLGRTRASVAPAGPFHARLAPHRLAALPDAVSAALRRREEASASSDRWGYQPGWAKSLEAPTELPGCAVRLFYPYRDIRLYRLFAGYPRRFFARRGVDRAVARAMLAGRLPDSIRLRRNGLPISPDYEVRLRDHAPQTLDRIAVFREAGVDDWLDLDWLDRNLRHVAARGPTGVTHAFEVQITAMAAEFLTFWRAA